MKNVRKFMKMFWRWEMKGKIESKLGAKSWIMADGIVALEILSSLILEPVGVFFFLFIIYICIIIALCYRLIFFL